MSTQQITVAAFDSLHKNKADITCEGVNDQIKIQEAINCLSSTGGTIKLLEGTFNISMSIKPRKGCRLIGNGEHSVLYLTDAPNSLLITDAHKGQKELKVASASGFQADMPITIVSSNFRTVMRIQSINGNTLILDGNLPETFSVEAKARVWAFFPVIDITEDSVVIKDLTIDGNRERRATFTETYLSSEGTVFSESEAGIYIHGGAEGTTIDGCYIRNTQGEGILVYRAGANQRFVNNKLVNIGDKGIVTCDISGPGLISDNYIDGTGRTRNFVSVKEVWGYGDCINLHPTSGKGWVVTNNILKNAHRSGIRMTGVSKSIASNNYISDCTDCGIIACVRDENSIIGNSVFRNGGGITLAFPGKYGSSTIVGNIISENRGHGIMVCGGKYIIIQGNSISNNGEHGIFITDKAYDIPVTEERWPEKPIRGEGTSSPSNRIVVSNNVVVGNSQKMHNTYDNIFIRNSSNILLTGNLCYKGEGSKKPKYGVNIASTSSHIIAKDNILKESGAVNNLHNKAVDG